MHAAVDWFPRREGGGRERDQVRERGRERERKRGCKRGIERKEEREYSFDI